MNVETLFEKFELLAEVPGAVEMLRELVLWHAFSGFFSGEERTQAVPAEWVREGAPIPAAIPKSWHWKRGCDVFDVIRGVSYKKSEASDGPVIGSLPILRANNIGSGINFDNLVYVPRHLIREEQMVRAGDIVIAMSSGSKKLVGKSAAIQSTFKGSFGAFCGVVRNKSKMLNEVLACYFLTPQYTSWVTAAGRGIGINNLSRADLDALPVPVPPLAEQKRIVTKVDELMALCDRLEAQQQEREAKHAALSRAALARFAEAPTPANLNFLFHDAYIIDPTDLRNSILTMAVQGKVVSERKDEGLAADELELIASKKAELVKTKAIRESEPPREIRPEEISHVIPDSWAWVRLASICELITDGTHLTPKYTESGRMFLSAQNVKPFKFMPAKHRFVSEEHYQGYIKNRKPTKGDILLTRVGAGIGEAATIDQDLDFAIYVSLGLIRVAGGLVFSDYITLWLNSPDGTEKSQRFTYGKGVSQGNLNLSLIRNFLVPLPPLAEQRRIVAKVEQLMQVVDQLEAQLAESRALGQRLLEAVVAELTGPLAVAPHAAPPGA